MTNRYPLTGLRVVEMGSGTAVPYLAKLFVDGGATVTKVESPSGDPFRSRSASGADLGGQDSAWFRFLNAGKASRVLDLDDPDQFDDLVGLAQRAHLILDDHLPAGAAGLGISPVDLTNLCPQAVIATVTPFGTTGPWANRPANEFVLQALVGSTDGRGVPGEEPASVGGDLGGFVAAAFAAPPVLGATLAAAASGRGSHLDISQFEAMMQSFQVYRPMFQVFDPQLRPSRIIEIPSLEPAKDGFVGFTCATGQQWQDFCAMIGHPEMAEDPELAKFQGRMDNRDQVWDRIRSFTTERTVDELLRLASDFRIPTGPIGTGDSIADLDHFAERGVYVESPHGHRQPRPPYQFSQSKLAPLRPAPALGDAATEPDQAPAPGFGSDPAKPMAGVKVLDLSAFWAGPLATNMMRVMGAEVTKIESHIRLDGMRWASGLTKPMLWEWSPVYHNANAGKPVVNLDLNTDRGQEIMMELAKDADVILENFSPRVTEAWGLTWDKIQEMNAATIFVRAPAFGLAGPWRERVGFAMTMEQVSGLANRTGHPDGPRLIPKGPVDSIAGMHGVFAVLMALVERERTGVGQMIELPLIEAALQTSAEQAVEFSAYGNVLERIGNRSDTTWPQGLYPTSLNDQWLAISIDTEAQWQALQSVVGTLNGVAHTDHDAIDAALAAWSAPLRGEQASADLWRNGVPAALCLHFNETGGAAQLSARGFLQWFDHPITGPTPYSSFPYQVDGRHLSLGGPAPTLGQDTRWILSDLGMNDDEINQLFADNVTGDWPANVPKPAEET